MTNTLDTADAIEVDVEGYALVNRCSTSPPSPPPAADRRPQPGKNPKVRIDNGFGITLPTPADSWKTVKRAEDAGFSTAWFYDTQVVGLLPFPGNKI
jgi:hypothetical protein